MGGVAVVFSTYNNPEHAVSCLDSIIKQTYRDIRVVISDDGSTDDTLKNLDLYLSENKINKQNNAAVEILPLPHGERGIARIASIEKALKYGPEYILFIDSDMTLEKNCIEICVSQMSQEPSCGALVVPEKPVSDYNNLWTRVKIFERTVLNDAGAKLDKNSIEAARFWRADAYKLSGGLNPQQTAFEEIQPTIRYIKLGGEVRRAEKTWVTHDEKHVTWENIFSKKKGYFTAMETTARQETNGFIEMLKRWYFFRPVMYRKSNLLRYLTHPILSFFMFLMYIGLTFSAVSAQIKAVFGRIIERLNGTEALTN